MCLPSCNSQLSVSLTYNPQVMCWREYFADPKRGEFSIRNVLPKLGLMFGINTLIATIFSALGVLGAVSSIRQIVLDTKHL
ncbi:hypothetical protein NC651_025684 [Populus alba x Populus x berolinensis]|nr:hypothetical protein NC651_025684 [Populus alba x Populus x berolinensis]